MMMPKDSGDIDAIWVTDHTVPKDDDPYVYTTTDYTYTYDPNGHNHHITSGYAHVENDMTNILGTMHIKDRKIYIRTEQGNDIEIAEMKKGSREVMINILDILAEITLTKNT